MTTNPTNMPTASDPDAELLNLCEQWHRLETMTNRAGITDDEINALGDMQHSIAVNIFRVRAVTIQGLKAKIDIMALWMCDRGDDLTFEEKMVLSLATDAEKLMQAC